MSALSFIRGSNEGGNKAGIVHSYKAVRVIKAVKAVRAKLDDYYKLLK